MLRLPDGIPNPARGLNSNSSCKKSDKGMSAIPKAERNSSTLRPDGSNIKPGPGTLWENGFKLSASFSSVNPNVGLIRFSLCKPQRVCPVRIPAFPFSCSPKCHSGSQHFIRSKRLHSCSAIINFSIQGFFFEKPSNYMVQNVVSPYLVCR